MRLTGYYALRVLTGNHLLNDAGERIFTAHTKCKSWISLFEAGYCTIHKTIRWFFIYGENITVWQAEDFYKFCN